MEWVETTARTVEEAKELALDRLGVVADEAEFTVLAEPKQGLFGRMRGEARVRARVRPAPVRPKQERRRGRKGAAGDTATSDAGQATVQVSEGQAAAGADRRSPDRGDAAEARPRARRTRGGRPAAARTPDAVAAPAAVAATPTSDSPGGTEMTTDEIESEPTPASEADIASVREAAMEFVGGLTTAFGFDATVDAAVEGSEIEVRVSGDSLGLLIGPGGRTLLAIQDLARVAAQRRLGDHDTRLRIDVAGYREKRRQALERFAVQVANQVKETGVAASLDPMPSADRKILHDALAAIDGVSSRSEGEDPNRRVVVVPD